MVKAWIAALSAVALIAAPAPAFALRKAPRAHLRVARAPHSGVSGLALRRAAQPWRPGPFGYPFISGPTTPGPALPGAPMEPNPNGGGGGGGGGGM